MVRASGVHVAQSPRHGLLQCLQSTRERSPSRLADQQMHVLGRDHVSCDLESVLAARLLQGDFKQSRGVWRGQQRPALVATDGDEM